MPNVKLQKAMSPLVKVMLDEPQKCDNGTDFDGMWFITTALGYSDTGFIVSDGSNSSDLWYLFPDNNLYRYCWYYDDNNDTVAHGYYSTKADAIAQIQKYYNRDLNKHTASPTTTGSEPLFWKKP